MKRKRIHFMAFLANIDPDPSITNIKLKNGFEIKRKPLMEVAALISILDNSTFDNAHEKLIKANVNSYVGLTATQDSYVYYIYNSFLNESEEEKFRKHKYLLRVVKLMKLFKQGDVNIPLEYQFYHKNKTPTFHRGAETRRHTSRNRYIIPTYEIQELEKFLDTTQLPFEKEFLKLAFENYLMSYNVYSPLLQFLQSIISLEILFKHNRNCNSNCISENVASFLVDDQTEFEKIYCRMRYLYKIRNNIVHEGDPKLNGPHIEGLIRESREYVRKSIIKFYKIDKDKKEVTEKLADKFQKINCK